MNIRIIERYVEENGRTHGVYFLDEDTQKTFECEVRYELGGTNYFSYKNEPRGIYLGITPITKGGGFKSFTAFSGIKVVLHEMARYSKKEVQRWADDIFCDFQNDTRVQTLFDKVCAKNNLHTVENVVQ